MIGFAFNGKLLFDGIRCESDVVVCVLLTACTGTIGGGFDDGIFDNWC